MNTPEHPEALPAGGLEQMAIVVEAALFSAADPLDLADLRRLFEGEADAVTLRAVLAVLASCWQGRGLALVEVAEGWRFQTRPELRPWLARLERESPPRYSRAVLETLAIVAYHQPVTRGDIEDIRGVTVNPAIVRTLEERGWIEAVGHRETPGRPALFATTARFLSDLNLRTLADLPPLDDLGQLVVSASPSPPASPTETV